MSQDTDVLRAVVSHEEASARDKVACLECARVEDAWDGAPMIEIDRDLAGWKEQAHGWRARAEKAETALAAMTEKYQKLVAWADDQLGTPCEQIRHKQEVENLTDRCRVLEEALRPFAAVAEHEIGTDETDSDLFRPLRMRTYAPPLTVGDFRRAASVLTEGSKP